MIKIFLQAFILRSGGGEKVRPIITTFFFEITVFFFFFSLTYSLWRDKRMKFKQSNRAVFFFFFFSSKGSPLFLSLAWHFGVRETHLMSIKRGILAGTMSSLVSQQCGWFGLYASVLLWNFVFKVKRKHLSLQMTEFHSFYS